MNASLAFAAGTALLAWASWPSLANPRSHGFYRFLAWECVLALVLLNLPVWREDPYGPHQIASWLLQLVSLAMVLLAVVVLYRAGRPGAERRDAELYGFERTTRLVTSGPYRWIRHPMYASLLYLAWAIFLKDMNVATTALVLGTSLALYATARREEAECAQYFGPAYAEYMRRTRRFVPFVF